MYLVFDTETTGFGGKARIVQIAMAHLNEGLELIESYCDIIKPDGYYIPWFVTKIHGITTEHARNVGVPIEKALNKFESLCAKSEVLVGHNLIFDIGMMRNEFGHSGRRDITDSLKHFCTMRNFRAYNPSFASYKLGELYRIHTGEHLENAHDAMADVKATVELLKILKSDDEFFNQCIDQRVENLSEESTNRIPIPGPEALYKKGLAYYKGIEGLSEDYHEAWAWLYKAAELGHFKANYMLGVMCASGEGVAKCVKSAIKYYVVAAGKGYAPAQYQLGCCYSHGTGIEIDQQQSINWFKKAAEKGHADAQKELKSIKEANSFSS